MHEPRTQRLGRLDRFDPAGGQVVLEPEQQGDGFWVGCPGVMYDEDRHSYLLTYRRRRPRTVDPDRGFFCAIAESHDGVTFRDVWSVRKEQLPALSMERFCLRKNGDGYTLYISYASPDDGRWRIDCLRAERPEDFDPTSRTPVLSPENTGTEGVKDPYVIQYGPVEYLFASYAESRTFSDEERRRAHETGDIYNTGMSIFPTGLAVGLEGHDFRWQGKVLGVGQGWDRYQARLSSLFRLGSAYVGFYDGSAAVEENFEERTGLAVSHDLTHWSSCTPAGPWLQGAGPHKTCRYFDVVQTDSGLRVYYEYGRADGSHDLRVAPLLVGDQGDREVSA